MGEQAKNYMFKLFVGTGIVTLWYTFNSNFEVGASYTLLLMFAGAVLLFKPAKT